METITKKPATIQAKLENINIKNINNQIENKSLLPNVRCCFPSEFYEIINNQFGEDKTFELSKIFNSKPNLCIRVNPLKTNTKEVYL